MAPVLYDALYPAGIPLDIPADALVASYVDHPEVDPPCMVQLAERFPNHVNVTISAHGHPAQIFDVEPDAIPVAEVARLIQLSWQAGDTPVVYCAPRTWPLVKAICQQSQVVNPFWWAVDRTIGQTIPDEADGNQWLGAGGYDQSIITDRLAKVLTAGGTVPAGGGTPEGTDVLDPNDPLVKRLLQSADLLNYLEQSEVVSSTFRTNGDTRTRIGLLQYQVGLLVAAEPAQGAPDLTSLTDLIKSLPDATVAAIKAAL